MSNVELLHLIEDKFYNVVRIGTYFAVSNKRVPTCEVDSDGYALTLRGAIKQAEKGITNE